MQIISSRTGHVLNPKQAQDSVQPTDDRCPLHDCVHSAPTHGVFYRECHAAWTSMTQAKRIIAINRMTQASPTPQLRFVEPDYSGARRRDYYDPYGQRDKK